MEIIIIIIIYIYIPLPQDIPATLIPHIATHGKILLAFLSFAVKDKEMKAHL